MNKLFKIVTFDVCFSALKAGCIAFQCRL